jgi:steroid 5-alpha reductase family enzyme
VRVVGDRAGRGRVGLGAIGLVGAIVMTVLLRRVPGVPMLERTMAKRRPAYVQYVERTSPFLPRPPRRT